MEWSYGVTTVPARIDTLLPRTLESLSKAGFDNPRLFVDQVDPLSRTSILQKLQGRPVSLREPGYRAFGNWVLGLWELYLAKPLAQRFAIFQDDLVTYRNLRRYLESCPYPKRAYLNLYTFPQNEKDEVLPKDHDAGWYLSNQLGKGAVGLVFDNEAVRTLLSQPHMVNRPLDPERGYRALDGGIVEAFTQIGWREFVHRPSLVQHTGAESIIGNGVHDLAPSFKGEEFDAMSLPIPGPANEQYAHVNPRTARWDRFMFDEALAELSDVENPVIVEIGAIRDARPIAARADGHSTIHWVKSGYRTWCVDRDLRALEITRKMTGEAANLLLRRSDGLDFLKQLTEPVTLLYLDGPDPKSGGPEFALECYKATTFGLKAVILIDDCDVRPGKGDLVIPVAQQDGFVIKKQDRQVLMVRDKRQPKQVKSYTKRIGLVGYYCDSGLGELNRQIADHVDVGQWLVKRHGRYENQQNHSRVQTIHCEGNSILIDQFLHATDVLLFCETPYYDGLVDMAKELDKRVVCVPMVEWTPDGRKGWTPQVDLYICPTKQCYDILKAEGHPCVYFPWPIDTKRFPFRERTICERFLFIMGRAGKFNRKGGDLMTAAKELFPELPLVVCSQWDFGWKEDQYTKVIGRVNEAYELYQEGDVLIAPHRADGLGLEPLEAMSCGIPVMTCNAPPWNENPAICRLPVTTGQVRIQRDIPWQDTKAESIVDACKTLLGRDISDHSIAVRKWSEARDWSTKVDEFTRLVREGVPS